MATAIRRSQAYVSKRLRVFEDPMLAPAILANQLTVSAAEELLAVPEHHKYDLLARAIQGNWEISELRAVIRAGRFEANQSMSRRRPGLIRRVRELRMELRDLVSEDLTDVERRELRMLFADLRMLARLKSGGVRQTLFRPLPTVQLESSR